jgi:hypothetical protein
MKWTLVPKAAVYEHRRLLPSEYEIWTHRCSIESQRVILAKTQPATVKDGSQTYLGASVATSIGTHLERGGGISWRWASHPTQCPPV